MPNVLLMVPPGSQPARGPAVAIEAARKLGGELIVLTVLDPSEVARIAASLDSAFIGDRVSDRVTEVLAREQRAQAESLLSQIAEQARQAGVPCRTLVEEGEGSDVCARVARNWDVAAAFLVAERKSWLTRLLARASGVRVPALPGCEVTVLED